MGKVHNKLGWALVVSTVLLMPAAVVAVDAPQRPKADGDLYSPSGRRLCQYPHHERKAQAAASRLTGVAEVEPNDTPATATVIPLGQPDNDLVISGTLNPNNEFDFYQVDLHRGDVLGMAMNSSFDSRIAVLDTNANALMDNDDMNGVPFLYPVISPLPIPQNPQQSLDACLSYVVPQDGTYLLGVRSFAAQSGGNYQMQVALRRPFLETQSFFIKQYVFVDFNGPTIAPMSLFGSGRVSAACSPMRNFLTNWGLTAADESPLIDQVMAVIKHKYDVLRTAALNGDRPTDGMPGHYDVVFHNSRDHVNNFGQPFVTRIVIGGTQTETGLATLGISSSVDPGNFDPQDTSLVLLDSYSNPAGDPFSVNSVLLANNFAKIDAIALAIGNTAAHELGHTLGNFHTDPNNDPPGDGELMDGAVADITPIVGTGPDGRLGTPDDYDVEFSSTDIYDLNEGVAFFPIVEDTQLQTAFALSTGKTPGGSGPQVSVFPDLVAMDMQVSAGQLVAGQTFTVTVKVGNAGAAPASNFLVALFLNQSIPTSSSSGAIAAVPVTTSIDPGNFTQVTLTAAHTACGSFTMAVLVNADNLIAESNVMNNMFFKPVSVFAVGSDLLISKLTVTEPLPGISASFDVVIQNAGMTATGPFQIGFYPNLGSAPTIADVPFTTATVAGLGAAAVTAVHFDLPTQNVPRAGYAWFFVDCTNAVAEDNETNNTAKASWGVPNNAPSIASTLTAAPLPAGVGETVNFSIGVSDPESDPVSFVWDFGDGATVNGGAAITHAYAAQGFYTARITFSDGPFHTQTASVLVEVVQSVVDLGTVHLGARRGRFTLPVPPPQGFSVKDRLKSTLVSGNPGSKVRYSNFKLTGTALQGVGPQPWQYQFLVEFQSRVTHKVVRVRYRYEVVKP